MASSTAPSTPEAMPSGPPPAFRRSLTVPAKLRPSPKTRPPPPLEDHTNSAAVETLFANSFAKVVSFSAAPYTARPSSSSSRLSHSQEQEDNGVLPWATPTERTLAAGPLRIYRVPGSVSFLNSGNLLRHILPRSQCWCVDERSKFVLRSGSSTYYRIELPYETDEDKRKAEDFKGVLANLLQYENTACPFRRGSGVDLPEEPPRPVSRRTWNTGERAKRWVLDDRVWEPEDRPKRKVEASNSGTASNSSEDEERVSIHTTNATEENPWKSDTVETRSEVTPPQEIKYPRPLPLRTPFGLRAVTEPVHRRPPRPPSSVPEIVADTVDSKAETASLSSSVESFYSVGGTNPNRSQTPPYLDAPSPPEEPTMLAPPSLLSESSHRGRRASELAVPPLYGGGGLSERSLSVPSHDGRPSSAPSTPTLVSDSEDGADLPFQDVTTPSDTIRLRNLTGASQRRAFSPARQPLNLFSPSYKSPRQQQFTRALVEKTAALILSPPAHLVALMLRIAAQITSKALRPMRRGRGERIPCSWDSDAEELEEWAEDDYGIPLGNLGGREAEGRRRPVSSGWDVD